MSYNWSECILFNWNTDSGWRKELVYGVTCSNLTQETETEKRQDRQIQTQICFLVLTNSAFWNRALTYSFYIYYAADFTLLTTISSIHVLYIKKKKNYFSNNQILNLAKLFHYDASFDDQITFFITLNRKAKKIRWPLTSHSLKHRTIEVLLFSC